MKKNRKRNGNAIERIVTDESQIPAGWVSTMHYRGMANSIYTRVKEWACYRQIASVALFPAGIRTSKPARWVDPAEVERKIAERKPKGANVFADEPRSVAVDRAARKPVAIRDARTVRISIERIGELISSLDLLTMALADLRSLEPSANRRETVPGELFPS
jgi:hypothetical protein